MISKNLLKALEAQGFNYVDNKVSDNCHAYGVYGGYLTTVYETSGNKVVYFNFKFSENEENDLKRYNMSEVFSNEIEEYSITDYSISEDGMRVFCNGNIPLFLKLIDKCVSLLIENEIRGVEFCSKCGNKFGSRKPKKLTYEKENHLMCEHCALDTVEDAHNAQAANNTSQSGNVAMGLLGSIIFSSLGAFLYFALYYWLSPAMSNSGLNEVRYIFCVAGFAVALLAYFGYRIFCKKVSLSAYLVVAINSLIFTSIGQYVGIVFEFVAKNSFATSVLSNKHFWLIHLRNTIPADVADLYTDYSAIFWKLLIISLMFAAVGAAIFLLSLSEKSKQKPVNIEIETITL